MPKLVTIKDAAIFAADVYYPESEILPDGWKVFKKSPDNQYGFEGRAYIRKLDDETVEVFIANRGTYDLEGLYNDVELALAEIPQQFTWCAVPFADSVLREIASLYPSNVKVSISVTGHSLGGALSTLVTLYLANALENDASPFQIVKGFNIDGPDGIAALVNQLPEKEQLLATLQELNEQQKLLRIVSLHDIVNACGDVDIKNILALPLHLTEYQRDCWQYLPINPERSYYLFRYTPQAHALNNMISYLSTYGDRALRYTSWPNGFEAGYEAYKTYSGVMQNYWDGYLHQLWNNNFELSTFLHSLFPNFDAFKHFYIKYFLDTNVPKPQSNDAPTDQADAPPSYDDAIKLLAFSLGTQNPWVAQARNPTAVIVSSEPTHVNAATKTVEHRSYADVAPASMEPPPSYKESLIALNQQEFALEIEVTKQLIAGLIAVQDKFAAVKQSPSRKQKVAECLDLCFKYLMAVQEKPIHTPLEKNVEDLISDIHTTTLAIQTEHDRQYRYFFLKPFKFFNPVPRTVKALNTVILQARQSMGAFKFR